MICFGAESLSVFGGDGTGIERGSVSGDIISCPQQCNTMGISPIPMPQVDRWKGGGDYLRIPGKQYRPHLSK